MELGSSINGTAFIPGVCGPKPTALGYQCSWAAPDGVILHWSYNVSHPPINRCTANNAAENEESRNLWDGQMAVHMALQAASRVGLCSLLMRIWIVCGWEAAARALHAAGSSSS
jgi:hypothetical protein